MILFPTYITITISMPQHQSQNLSNCFFNASEESVFANPSQMISVTKLMSLTLSSQMKDAFYSPTLINLSIYSLPSPLKIGISLSIIQTFSDSELSLNCTISVVPSVEITILFLTQQHPLF